MKAPKYLVHRGKPIRVHIMLDGETACRDVRSAPIEVSNYRVVDQVQSKRAVNMRRMCMLCENVMLRMACTAHNVPMQQFGVRP